MKQWMVYLILVFLSRSAFSYIPISDDRLKELLEEFNYSPVVEVIKLPKVDCKPQDLEYSTTYPQRETPMNIKAKAFIPAGSQLPVVFMLPSLGGMNQLDQAMGETFCKNNIAAILISTGLTGLDTDSLVPVTDHDHTYRRAVAAIKGGIVIAGSMPAINIKKIGILGISLGGILGSVAYGVMPEISAGTFLVNGGDVPHILAYSDQSIVIKLRTARMAEQNLQTFEEYEEYLRKNLKLDPLHFTKLIDTSSTKLFLSRKDLSVPTPKQLEYYEAIGSPSETSFYSLSHINTIISVLGVGTSKPKIAQWFLSRFALPNPRRH